MLKGVGKTNPFKQSINRGAKLPPEWHSWYWHPNRIGVKEAPTSFSSKLKELGDDLKITWHPLRERWGVFVRDHKLSHPVCWGWKLLFIWEVDGEYAPLDERLLAKIWDRSGRKWGNLHEYWIKVEQAQTRDREKAERSREDDVRHSAGDYYSYTLIKNIGSGSKFVNHQQG